MLEMLSSSCRVSAGRARTTVVVVALLSSVALGCQSHSKKDQDMPAASSWTAPSPVSSQTGAAGDGSDDPNAGMDMNNPHAGMDMNNPHAGMDMNNPHAGMDMNNPHAGMDMNNPHAGMDTDPAMAAMRAPDPARAIDPSKFLRGTIDATPALRKLVKPGAIMFLAARPIDPLTGDILGAPLAVERIDVAKLPTPFELTGANAMVAGTEFAGSVLIEARIDGDGEARSKEPGDIVGTVKAKIPTQGIQLTLDTKL